MVDKHIPNDTLLYLNNVTVSFDGFRALDELSFMVREKELSAIIGPNGAGKSTMMDVVTGKTRPDSGEVFFHGEVDLTRYDETEVANMGIGRKFQKPSVIESLTVWENLELALAGRRTPFASMFGALSSKGARRIDEVMELIRLSDRKAWLGASLSHGQKQWLEIGMLLMQNPLMLLVDEPAAGMTHQEMDRTVELLTSLSGKHSVVVVEHDMDFVRALNSRVTVLHQGTVLAEGSMDDVQNNQKVIEVYLGE